MIQIKKKNIASHNQSLGYSHAYVHVPQTHCEINLIQPGLEGGESLNLVIEKKNLYGWISLGTYLEHLPTWIS